MAKKRRNPELEESDLLNIIEQRKNSSLNYSEGELALKRESLMRRYMGEKYGNEKDGQSKVVTRQCLEAVEWTLPSLLRVFMSSPTIAEFDPESFEDEKQARQESIAVNKVLKSNDGFMTILFWIKDMLMNPGAYIKVYWDEKKTTRTENYSGLMEQEAEELLAQEGVEAIEWDSNTISVPTEAGLLELETFDLKIRRTSTKGRIVVDSIPAEEVSVDGKLTTVSLEDSDFVNHSSSVSRSKLIEMGYDPDIIYGLPSIDDPSNEERARKELTTGEYSDASLNEANDPSSEQVTIDESYMWVDFDGDGIAEFRQVMSSPDGAVVLSNDEHDILPIIGTTAVPLPHSPTGQSWMELVEDIQEIYTTITRQTLDNAYRTNNPRTVAGKGVNLVDLMSDVLGMPIRANDVSQLRTEPIQPIIGQVIPLLDMIDKMKETRIGVSKGTMGLDADALARVTDGNLRRSMQQANQRIEALARIFAESGLKPLMLKIHQLMTMNQDTPYQMKLQGEWSRVDPSSWRMRDSMTVTVGLGSDDKTQMELGLKEVINTQRQDAQTSMRFVNEANQYNARVKLVDALGLHNPEQYFTDPSTLPPPQPPPPDPAIEVQKEFNQVEREKAQLKNQEAQMETKRKYEKDMQDMQAKIYELELKLTKESSDQERADIEQVRKNYDTLMNSEYNQSMVDPNNVSDLDRTQDAYRGEMNV